METEVSVSWVLQLPEVRRAVPEVLAGRAALGRPVRWAHVAEIAEIASVLKGGELLLTTGMGLGARRAQRLAFIEALAERDVAGLMVELGTSLPELPAELVAAAERVRLPLIALHRPALFVEITEAIHRELVNREHQTLRHGRELQQQLTQLALDGAGPFEILDAVSALIDNPVLLERRGNGIVYSRTHRAGSDAVLAAYEAVRRDLPDAPPVVAQPVPIDGDAAWGRLLAIGIDSPLGDADRIAVEQAGSLIALALLRSRQDDLLTARHRGNLLTGLQQDRIDEASASAHAADLGFSRDDQRFLLPIAVMRHQHSRLSVGAVDDDTLTLLWRDLDQELRERHIRAIVGLRVEQPAILLVLSLGDDPGTRTAVADRVAAVIHEIVGRCARDERAPIVCVGGAARSWTQVRRQLLDAADALPAAARAPAQRWHDASRPDLGRTLWSLRDSMQLRAFVHAQLHPILQWDRRHGTQLLQTLIAYCEHDGRKAETARAIHVERQSLYHRLARIEELLGASLQHPDTRLGVQLALRATRYMPIRSELEVTQTGRSVTPPDVQM